MASLDKLKICYYNARSVRAKAKADEVFNFLCKEEVEVHFIIKIIKFID